jgi:hypothetical protein
MLNADYLVAKKPENADSEKAEMYRTVAKCRSYVIVEDVKHCTAELSERIQSTVNK